MSKLKVNSSTFLELKSFALIKRLFMVFKLTSEMFVFKNASLKIKLRNDCRRGTLRKCDESRWVTNFTESKHTYGDI
jgi:hypothetical protein